ncbi:hypothetical protein [uncultured Methanolobus sp.]|uniref:hypothetical protein n=1 Tax=uncultured Methanolobus sp. TaxID=218300 RepID=UPI0029C90CF7|nr:hypothetical protein [uncultured Methanolobus sp.]
MYIKTTCTKCGNPDFHDIHWWIIGEIKKDQATARVDEMEVYDSVSEEELARQIVCELRGFIYNGMTVDEFCRILKKYYGVASKYCCDLIQRMKKELDMYCPDRQHLYYVEARSP